MFSVIFIFPFIDDKERLACTPLLRTKGERSKSQDSGPTDLPSVEANVDAGHYTSLAQFDSDVNSILAGVMREHGRLSTMGAAAAQLRKVRNL